MQKLKYFYQLLKNKWIKFLERFQGLGPAAPLVFMVVFALMIFFTSRLILNIIYLDRVLQEPQFYLMYLFGIRMDMIVICYYLSLPTLFFFLLPKKTNSYLKYFWIFYLTFFIDVAFFMEMATYPFLKEYDLRPDAIFVRYLQHYKEVLGTVWTANKSDILITFTLLFFVHRLAWASFKKLVNEYRPVKWYYRTGLIPILAVLIFLGARSSLKPRPANISSASFSEKSKLVNEITLNSTYSVFYAVTRLVEEKDPSAIYGNMEEKEVFSRVKKNTLIREEYFTPSEIPFLHKQVSPFKRERPLNVVIVLEESLGAEYVGALGGLPLTPNLDRLSKEGLFFTNLYSTGTRTVRGIEATIAGFLPTPGSSVVNLGLSKNDFFTAGELFKKHGYTTEFIYGGESNFDEMRSFFLGNGFTNIYDLPTFKDPVFEGVWGVSDEDLMRKAHEVFSSHGDKPFFAVVLSTSNHSPFEFPDGRIQLHEQSKAHVHNAMKYADYAIGLLFDLAKKSDYYKNTIFLVLADHNTRVFGDDFVPVHKFHIPALMIGPDVPAKAFDKVVSQVDLLPTILHFSGLATSHPMVGRNLMELPENDPGRAIMQYGNNYGYRVGDTVVVLKPHLEPKAFIYNKEKKLVPCQLNDEMYKDALAHSLLPWNLYESKRYRVD
ncbi:MAG: LTA synthase family protein [Cytophagaceae bacterium]|nr:LTA synthase family protein [Cytophagaceae bacterium]